MNIDPFLIWLEATPLSQWIVGSPSMFVFPGFLVLHAIGMGLAAGLSAALDLRVLGVAARMPLVEFRRFRPVLWFGFWLNAVSGVLLLIGYPTKALTNPVFYLKLLLITTGMVLMARMQRAIADERVLAHPATARRLRRLAAVSLVCWAGAIFAGRLLAYTHTPADRHGFPMIHDLQVWLVTTIGHDSAVSGMMRSAWGWPIAESLHFLGLTMLVGCIGTFDLRLLGVARRVPIAVVHRFIPWGIAGFVLNATTGALFLLTEPDQYIYNVSFHLKLLFLTIGGTNAALFYLTSYRQAFGDAAVLDAPRHAKVIAAVSLCAWTGVIVCGRLLTFYRPAPCPEVVTSLLMACFPP